MKKKTIYLLMSLCSLILLSGCSNSEEQAQQKENESKLKEITLVLDWTPNTNHTGIYTAQRNGYFEQAGFQVNIVQPPEDGATLMVASGQAQFGIDFQEYLAPAFATDDPLPVTAVAAIIQHNTSGFVSLKEKGIETPADMQGHTYATWDMDVEKAILKYIIEQDGGNYGELKMIPSTVTDIVTALQTDFDLVWIYQAWDGIALEVQGIETNYIDLAGQDQVLDFYSPVLIANNDYLKENEAEAKAFLSAVKKGYEFAMEQPQEAARILCEAAPELDEEIVLKSQEWLKDQYQSDAKSWGIIDPKRWDGFYGWLYEKGVIEVEIPKGSGFSNEYLE